jgi:prolyl-tRNA synthetase
MGCYGVGISRLVAVMIEASNDEKGCIWNKQTAPYHLDIIISNVKNEDELAFGENLYKNLKKDRFEVLLDDRKERFGPKIKDFELIGFPYAVIIGKGLLDGTVELVERKTLEKTVISVDEVEAKIRELLS